MPTKIAGADGAGDGMTREEYEQTQDYKDSIKPKKKEVQGPPMPPKKKKKKGPIRLEPPMKITRPKAPEEPKKGPRIEVEPVTPGEDTQEPAKTAPATKGSKKVESSKELTTKEKVLAKKKVQEKIKGGALEDMSLEELVNMVVKMMLVQRIKRMQREGKSEGFGTLEQELEKRKKEGAGLEQELKDSKKEDMPLKDKLEQKYRQRNKK